VFACWRVVFKGGGARGVECAVSTGGKVCMRAGKLHALFLLAAVTLAQACDAGARGDNGEIAPPGKDPSKAAVRTQGDRVSAGRKDYADPDGAFSIKIPDGWKVEREEASGAHMTGAQMTVVTSEEYRAANLSIMTFKDAPPKTDPADLQDYMLTEGSEPFFRNWVDGLKEQARVEGKGNVYRTRVDNVDALRMDITYYRGDADDPRKGYALFLIGPKTTFFISLTGNRQGFEELEKIISTLDIEP
jgi:hypothetical protein